MPSILRALVCSAILVIFALHPGSVHAKSVPLTSAKMALLQQVNTYVNGTIIEVSDMEQYGKADVWALPLSGKGDCEDFAMLKRKMLVERGWPASSLSISVGITAQGEAHAVLTVATDRGDYVLDNLTSNILLAQHTGHTFHSRQSGRGWISATGERTSAPTADFPVASVPSARTASRGR